MTSEDRSYQPQVGHRVRRTHVSEGLVVSVEGNVVSYADHSLDQLAPTREPGARHDQVSWERLPDPEPTWQPGDVARDANGTLFQRRSSAEESGEELPWLAGGGDWESEDRPVRPLVRLVPEETIPTGESTRMRTQAYTP